MKLTTRDMLLTGLFTGLMVVGAKLSLPTPFGVPLTFQLFFAVYAGILLGAKKAFLSQFIYIIIGLAGLPVFSLGGGIQYVFKNTFGYIIGFMVCAFIIGLGVDKLKKIRFRTILGISLVGYGLAYLIGNIYFYGILQWFTESGMPLYQVFVIMFPYMIKDLILIVLASYSATLVMPILRRTGYVTV